MVSKGRHPRKPIGDALAGLDSHFVVTEIHKGHRWGVVRCDHCGDQLAVWSTPKVPEDQAARIRRFRQRHQH